MLFSLNLSTSILKGQVPFCESGPSFKSAYLVVVSWKHIIVVPVNGCCLNKQVTIVCDKDALIQLYLFNISLDEHR